LEVQKPIFTGYMMRKLWIIPIVILFWPAMGSLRAIDFDSDYYADDACTMRPISFWLTEPDTAATVIWKFGDNPNDSLVAGTSDIVSHEYLQSGTYSVTAIIGDNVDALTKTGYTIERTVRANFQIENYAPLNYRVVPTDAISDASATYRYQWNYKDAVTGLVQGIESINVAGGQITRAIDSVQFDPGTYTITLIVDKQAANFCSHSFSRDLVVSAPNLAHYFTTDTTEGCTPLDVNFRINPATLLMDTVRSIRWNFGNGPTLKTKVADTTITYPNGGYYDVSMSIESTNGSMETIELPNYIHAYHTVSAEFRVDEFDADYTFRMVPTDTLPNDSIDRFFHWTYLTLPDSSSYVRDTDRVNFTNQRNAIDTLQFEAGSYLADLVVIDSANQCVSHFSKMVVAREKIQVPNIFLPGEGQQYIIDPQNIATVLLFKVFNRYGTPIFSQTAPIIQWDGRASNGTYISDGVYFYTLEATVGDPLAKIVQKGFIHIY